MRVVLRDLTADNWLACIALQVAPAQERFVASNLYSIAESRVMPTYVPQAIVVHDEATGTATMVGFTMYGLHPTGNPPWGRRHWIHRLMIDQRFQGQGYGCAALEEVLRRLSDDPACPDVLIGFSPDNTLAERLYRRLGFVDFGHAPWNNDTVLRRDLRGSRR